MWSRHLNRCWPRPDLVEGSAALLDALYLLLTLVPYYRHDQILLSKQLVAWQRLARKVPVWKWMECPVHQRLCDLPAEAPP